MKQTDEGLSRRTLLAGMGTATLGILAGCQGQGLELPSDAFSTAGDLRGEGDDEPDTQFDIAPAGDHQLNVSYARGDESKPLSKFRVAIYNAGSADGTYPLGAVTDDETFDVGDSYALDQTTLGLDEPLDYSDAAVFLDFKSDIGWNPVIGAEFGSATKEDDAASKLDNDTEFGVSPSGENQLTVTYEQGTESFQVSAFRVVIFGAKSADGTYPLSAVTDDETFDAGDSYTLDEETLGLDGPLTYDEAVIRLEFDGKWRWEFVTAVQFGHPPEGMESTEGFGRDVEFVAVPAGPNHLDIEYKRGAESLPVSKFRVVISNAGSADGAYRLDTVTDDEMFDVGDLYPLDRESLSLDEPFDYRRATVAIQYQFENGWNTVSRTEFGSSSSEDSAVGAPVGEYRFSRVGAHQLSVECTAGDVSSPVSRFRVVISNAGSADGAYPLTELTDDEMFDVGDSYLLDQETLGLDEPFDYENAEVLLEFDFGTEWGPVGGIGFGDSV